MTYNEDEYWKNTDDPTIVGYVIDEARLDELEQGLHAPGLSCGSLKPGDSKDVIRTLRVAWARIRELEQKALEKP